MKALPKVTVPKEFKLPANAPHAACLAIFNREDGAMFKIPLTEKENGDLWGNLVPPCAPASKLMIAEAIRKMMAEREHYEADQAFEEAARKAICLLDLLLSKQIAEADTKLDHRSPRYDEERAQTICGLQDLVIPVIKELTAGICGPSKTGTEVAA